MGLNALRESKWAQLWATIYSNTTTDELTVAGGYVRYSEVNRHCTKWNRTPINGRCAKLTLVIRRLDMDIAGLYCDPKYHCFVLLWHTITDYGRSTEQATIFCSCGFFFLYFFLAYSQRSQIGCLPHFHTWCGLSANLECMSEMCYTRGSLKIQDAKIRHPGTIAQLCRAISSQLRHISTTRPIVKQ